MEPPEDDTAVNDEDADALFAKAAAANKAARMQVRKEQDMDLEIDGVEFSGLSKREQRKLRQKKRKEIVREVRKERIKRRKENEQNETGLITEQHIDETTYIFNDGFRRVVPYAYTFEVRAKPRWYGKTLLEAVAMDFRAYDLEHWTRATRLGLVQVNAKVVTCSSIMKHKDLLWHRVHRHEPPVTGAPIRIVYEDNDLLAIDKPPSIPIHPSGRYRHNTVTFILAHERSQRHLYVVHRLDRLTSGVLILAKRRDVADAVSEKIRSSAVQKEYYARVEGVFPEGVIEVDQPILVDQSQGDACYVDERGKPSQTTFIRLSTNGKESVVRCLPKTGRTHQIRVHLNWLGFPISNDPLYNARVREARGSVLLDDDENCQDLLAPSLAPWAAVDEMYKEGDVININTLDPVAICPDCHGRDPSTSRFKDPNPDEMCIYLHAYSYKSDEWSFQTEIPSWATLPSLS